MKKVIALCLVLVLALSLVACTKTAAPSTTPETGNSTEATTSTSTETSTADTVLTIGFSWAQKNDTLYYGMADTLDQAVKATMGEHGYTEVVWIDAIADNNADTQANDIADFISRGVDLIAVYACDSVAIGASIEKAKDAGIPIVLYDRAAAADVAQPDMFVGLDTEAQAYDAGMAFFQHLKDNNVEPTTVLSVIGALNDQNAVNRKAGFERAADEFGWKGKFVDVPSDWNADTALANFTTAWQANPETNVVLIASDFIITSVQSVLEANDAWYPNGDPNHVWVCSQDGYPVGIEYATDGYIDFSGVYNLDGMAALFAENIYTLLDGGSLPNHAVACGPILQTPENISTETWWATEY